MRSSLFLKIFLWFWLAMSLVGAILIVSGELARPELGPGFGRQYRAEEISGYAGRSMELMGERGEAALQEYYEQLEQDSGMRLVLYDAEGQKVAGRPDLEVPARLLQDAVQSQRVEFGRMGRGLLVARAAARNDSEIFILVGLVPGPFRDQSMDPTSLGLRLLAVLGTGGLVCYGLALYLSAPVRRLQEVVRRFSGGDLGVRVGQGMGKRGDEFADLGLEFDQMAERIERLLESQRRLLTDISHELRSPLARLNVALELARKRSGGEVEPFLDRIEHESGQMNQLIGQLLTLARLEDGSDTLRLQEGEVELGSLVDEIVEDANFEASIRGCSVSLIHREECWVKGASSLLKSAIENIIRNGIHYTAEGKGVEIRLERFLKNGGSWVRVAVRDHGPGVPREALSELFRPFFRVDDSRDRQSGGAGLGLAISDRIIRLYGGTVEVENIVDGGLIVTLALPLSNPQVGHSSGHREA